MPKETRFDEAVAAALAGVSPRVVTLDITASTNDDARALAREGAPHLSVVVAEEQTAGRGRLDRRWHAAAGECLLASWIVRPTWPADAWTLLPLAAGVAIADAVRDRTRVEAVLKWPNDVLVGDRKLAGILTEVEPPDAVIVGAGVNVAQAEWPDDLSATSLALEGAIRLDRADLLAAIMRTFAGLLDDRDAVLERYRSLCASIGRTVRVRRTGAPALVGTASGIDDRGALLVDGVAVAAGDVVHVR